MRLTLNFCVIIDSVLIALGLTQTCFEGAMYLFVFLWVPSLQSCTLLPLPLGYIFAAFMVSMMLGSLAYSFASSTAASRGNESSLSVHAKLSSLLLVVAAFALAVGSSGGEHRTFWAFCLFEACVGVYYPVQGMLRSQLIANEHRATVRLQFCLLSRTHHVDGLTNDIVNHV
jgi:MFS transporter, MFS domain-containing protein family, molybdate-anion transporter